MQFVAILFLLICYGLAVYIGWLQRTPLYLLTLVAGHFAALASPLWRSLYAVAYNSELTVVRTIFGQLVPVATLLGAGWFYAVPALIVLYLYTARWWFPGGVTGLLTLMVFVLYHLLIETIGLRSQTWAYSGPALPLGLSKPLLAAVMAALVSYGLLYAVLAAFRNSWQSMAIGILPAPLLLSLLVHGLLGAPLWAAVLLGGADWVLLAGLLSTLLLLAWAAQIITGGIRRLAL